MKKSWTNYLLVIVRITAFLILILSLIMVRKLEDTLFYDPFLSFFKGDFYTSKFPEYHLGKIITNITFRYFLNSLLSLAIIYLIFLRSIYLKYAIYIFCAFFILLLPIYVYFVETKFMIGENVGFYVRRFLIQPLVLLILIPAFFYHQHNLKNSN